MMGEQAIDEERVDDDQGEGKGSGDTEGVGDWNTFVDSVRVLKGVVLEGEVLVVRFEGIKNPKADYAGAEWSQFRFNAESGPAGEGCIAYIRITQSKMYLGRIESQNTNWI